MEMNDSNELERFKTMVDLRLMAARFGYWVDPYVSCPRSTVMRDDAGDKVVIRVNPRDGHYEYFSVHDDQDCGSIVDFVQHRVHPRPNLGEVRKDLRDFMGWIRENQPKVKTFPKLEAAASDRAVIEAAYDRMERAEEHPFLVKERSISIGVLISKRFLGRIRKDGRDNVIFPHFGRDGVVCGYEIRNRNFKGFSSGGVKGLWLSHQWPDPFRAELEPDDPCLLHNGDWDIVFCESAIDALSHASLFQVFHRRYASLGGRPSVTQIELVKDAILALQPLGSEKGLVIAATDADQAGDDLAEMIASAFLQSGRNDLIFRRDRPERGKDWNDVLRSGKKPGGYDPFSRDENYAKRVALNAYRAIEEGDWNAKAN